MRNKYYSLETDGKSAEIVIYGDVTSWPWIESDVSSYNLANQLKGLDADEITVGINSYGGEVGEGLAIYNALRNHKAHVTTKCDGFACSVASVIFMAGDSRIMNEASMMMVHNAWTGACGNAEELRKAADDVEKINEASVKAYMSRATCEESEIRALMDAESWISPEEAVELGLATEIAKSEDSDKPSQNVRRKVMQMLRNPYRQALEDEEDPEEIEETPEGETDEEETPETDGEPETEGETPDEGDESEKPEPEEGEGDTDDDEKNGADKAAQFLKAIMNM